MSKSLNGICFSAMLALSLLFVAACKPKVLPPNENALPKPSLISEKEALQIAEIDAKAAYGNLELYTVRAVLDRNTWLVDYELRDPNLNGGGPHYIIDAKTGAVLDKHYEQ